MCADKSKGRQISRGQCLDHPSFGERTQALALKENNITPPPPPKKIENTKESYCFDTKKERNKKTTFKEKKMTQS